MESFETKHTSEDLKIMQSWPLDRKIRVSQLRIMEWYEHFNGNVYVSFSGGKDSTVLLDLARRIYPDIPAVFVDTGLEYPEIKEFVRSQGNVSIIRPKMVFTDVISKYGYPIIGKEVAEAIYYARQIHPKRKSKDVQGGDKPDTKESNSWAYDQTEAEGTLGKTSRWGGRYRRMQLLPHPQEKPHGSTGEPAVLPGGNKTIKISKGVRFLTSRNGFPLLETSPSWSPIIAAML